MKVLLKIVNLLSSRIGIRSDLIKHYFACLIPSLLGLYGAAFAFGLAIGKEYGDSVAKGNKWDWSDIIADSFGILTGLIIHFLILIIL